MAKLMQVANGWSRCLWDGPLSNSFAPHGHGQGVRDPQTDQSGPGISLEIGDYQLLVDAAEFRRVLAQLRQVGLTLESEPETPAEVYAAASMKR